VEQIKDLTAPGANIFKMPKQSRHKSLAVLYDDVRNHDSFADHAGQRFPYAATGTENSAPGAGGLAH
jgi:hypothetical protein